jgi:hypothetical protein
MKKLAILTLVALGLSACAKTTTPNGMMDWNNMGGAKVAKVNNIKSLISPGVY